MSKKLNELSQTDEGKQQLTEDLKKYETELVFKYGGIIKPIIFVVGLIIALGSFGVSVFFIIGAASNPEIGLKDAMPFASYGLALFGILVSMLSQLEKSMREVIKDHIQY